MSRLDVCVVGEINPDLIFYGLPAELKPEEEILAERSRFTLGSSSAIFAHNLSALGTSVGIISKIGNDVFGEKCLEWLGEAQVDTSRVVADQGEIPTGLTVILAQTGHRFILTNPGTMHDFRFEDIDLDYLFSARHLHVSSFFLHKALRPRIAELFAEAKKRGLTTSLDPNDDPEGKWGSDLTETLKYVDIFFPNEREAKQMTRSDDLNDAVRKLAIRVPILAVKLGPKGAMVREGDQEFHCAAVGVNSVDAVGAGDSFDGGFLQQFLKNAKTEECLRYGAIVGAYSTTSEGGIEAFRDRVQLARFLEQQSGT